MICSSVVIRCTPEGAFHGVPVVGAGKTEGKNDIAARVGYNHLGIDLRNERPKLASIRAAVHRALTDATSATNVDAVRREFASFDPLRHIEAVLDAELPRKALIRDDHPNRRRPTGLPHRKAPTRPRSALPAAG